MNGDQFPHHLWFLHEKYFGLFESEDVIMRDSDFSSVFYILSAMEKYHSDRPYEYWITYEGDDVHSAKSIVQDYQERVQYFSDDSIIVSNYIKNFT